MVQHGMGAGLGNVMFQGFEFLFSNEEYGHVYRIEPVESKVLVKGRVLCAYVRTFSEINPSIKSFQFKIGLLCV